MDPVDFELEQTVSLPPHDLVTYAKDQPQYRPLPVAKIHGEEGRVVSRWALTDAERAKVAAGEDLYLEQLTFGHSLQPILPSIGLREMCPADRVVDGPPSGDASSTIRTDYSREELIAICERAVVPLQEWMNRDTPGAMEKLGQCWVMLKAGCDFTIHRPPREGERGCFTDHKTIWLRVAWPNFNDFEYGERHLCSESEQFYVPTPARLDDVAGKDWY